MPRNTNIQAENCLKLKVSPKKNQPKNTAATGSINKNGENLLAGNVQIAKLYKAYAITVSNPKYITRNKLAFITILKFPPVNIFKKVKNNNPPITDNPARKNGGYLSIKYFVVITQVSVRIIAISSKKFPSKGFGANFETSDETLKKTEPIMDINNPKYTIFTKRSFNIILAAITSKTGSRELTIPA